MTDQNTNVHELKNKVSKFAQERNWKETGKVSQS